MAQPSLAELMRTMSSVDALDEVTTRPWHLQLAVTVYDETGKSPQAGTIDVWQAGADRRVDYRLAVSSRTELRVEGKAYFVSIGDLPAHLKSEVLEGFLHPGPQAVDLESSSPQLRTLSGSSQTFDCVMLVRPGMKNAPVGLLPTYCAARGSAELRVSYPSESYVLQRQMSPLSSITM